MGQGGHMHKFTFIFALLLAGPLMASDWMPITSGDLRAGVLLTSEAQVPASRHAETRPVSFARPLDIDSSASTNAGPQTDSREYWVDAKSEQLARGLELPQIGRASCRERGEVWSGGRSTDRQKHG